MAKTSKARHLTSELGSRHSTMATSTPPTFRKSVENEVGKVLVTKMMMMASCIVLISSSAGRSSCSNVFHKIDNFQNIKKKLIVRAAVNYKFKKFGLNCSLKCHYHVILSQLGTDLRIDSLIEIKNINRNIFLSVL